MQIVSHQFPLHSNFLESHCALLRGLHFYREAQQQSPTWTISIPLARFTQRIASLIIDALNVLPLQRFFCVFFERRFLCPACVLSFEAGMILTGALRQNIYFHYSIDADAGQGVKVFCLFLCFFAFFCVIYKFINSCSQALFFCT